jgi:transketolase
VKDNQAPNLAKYVRLNSIRMTHNAGVSHIGSSLSIAEILATIYCLPERVAKIKIESPDRDVVVVSKGHAAAATYAALAGCGILEECLLDDFCTDGSLLVGHVSHMVEGVEFSTGSLGHGLSLALGVSIGKKLQGNLGECFCICSDGELNEGSTWEAIAFAGHSHVNNLTLLLDYNRIQSFGFTKDVLDYEPIAQKFQSFGWTSHVVDGHDLEALGQILNGSHITQQPRVLICNTIKGKGLHNMENSLESHYRTPDPEDVI